MSLTHVTYQIKSLLMESAHAIIAVLSWEIAMESINAINVEMDSTQINREKTVSIVDLDAYNAMDQLHVWDAKKVT